MNHSDELTAVAAAADRILKQNGLGSVVSIESVAGGRNNRVFRLTGNKCQWLLKQYFQSGEGGRDRCGSEWDWLTFCWQQSVTWGPEPILCNPDENLSLIEFIEGRRLRADEIDVAHVDQAAAFVSELKTVRDVAAADLLGDAAEACFSIQQHLDCVQRRIVRLRSLPPADVLDQQLQDWLSESLFPVWKSISDRLLAELDGNELSRELEKEDRCLSPSDFGFHNALLTPSGRLRFLDFEYAGWDDPAKLVCDFYWQQDRPAPRHTRPKLISELADQNSRHDLEKRIEILTPVYGVKWCCLVLNEFVAEDRRRREFAQSRPVSNDLRTAQLERAKRLLVDVQGSIENG